ncbi:NADH-quinone oxidoreductase subunit J [Marinobacter salicampi]|uniref:NADH-quinone oxidoreductase subunit J n=1 Tax=Marinobacter salicampi TaxID=435907 RepID=UPI00140CFC7D|nr:NADH-quinone oxidoreductase subunit J [Marinobacter salicampi]
MEIAFYISGLVAVLATLGVITGTSPAHAVLYLIISLIAVAMVFFALGAPFAGVLEIIVYAGAIMVLFVFVVMMLNLGRDAQAQERQWLRPVTWIGPSVLATVLLGLLLAGLMGDEPGRVIAGELLTAKAVALILFGPWLMVVELAAMLLLAALVTASHVGKVTSAKAQTGSKISENGGRS